MNYYFFFVVNSKLEITTSGMNIAGEEYTLNCTLSGVDENLTSTLELQWHTTNELDITNDTLMNVMVSNFETQLMFNPLKISHEGMYTCQVLNHNNVVQENMINITVNGN